jgi:hypothetical protein
MVTKAQKTTKPTRILPTPNAKPHKMLKTDTVNPAPVFYDTDENSTCMSGKRLFICKRTYEVFSSLSHAHTKCYFHAI